MKSWTWGVFVFILTAVLMFLIEIPLWAFLIIAAPLLVVVFTYGSFRYSFRKGLKAEVPGIRYNSRIIDLDNEKVKAEKLGFEKIDSFYLRMIPDSVTYVLKHREKSIYLLLYHFGTKRSFDLFTRFSNGYTLTSCDNVDGGMSPRPAKYLMQILPRATYTEVFDWHSKALEFLKEKGFKTYDLAKEEFRLYFIKSLFEYARFISKYPFWPVLLIFWTITKRGRVLCKSIQEQVAQGKISLF